jgi:hypothetical protein
MGTKARVYLELARFFGNIHSYFYMKHVKTIRKGQERL